MKMTSSQWSVAIILVIVVLTVILVACGAFTKLQTVIDAAAAAVPVLESAGVNIPPVVVAYVEGVAGCVANQVGNPTPEQIAAITSCLAGIVVPTLPPGMAKEIVVVVQGLATAVENYLASEKTAGKPVSLNAVQTMKVNKMRDEAQGIVDQCRKIRAHMAAHKE